MSASSGLLLALDTSGAGAGLALAGDGCIDEEPLPVRPDGTGRTEDLADAARRLLAARGAAVADLAGLVLVVGPGSYTGLRAGLAFARGLALPRGLPAVGVGSLELAAWRAASSGEVVRVAAAAGRERALLGAWRRTGDDVAQAGEALVLQDRDEAGRLAGASSAPLVVVGAAAEGSVLASILAAAAARGHEVRGPGGGGLAALARLGAGRFERGLAAAVGGLVPAYIGEAAARPNRHRIAAREASE